MAEPAAPPAPPVGAPPPGFDPNALKKVYLFESLTPQELKYLASVVKKREFHAASAVFREGDEAQSLFIVEQGTLQVVKTNLSGGAPIVVSTMGQGTLLGEIPFVAGGRRTANILAQDQVTLIELRYEELERLAQLNPVFGMKLYKALAAYLAKNLRNTTDEIFGPKPEIKPAVRKK